MQFRHWLATLLGVASLLLVFSLAKNNLNKATGVVNVQNKTDLVHPVHSWNELFGENTDHPPALLAFLQDSFEVNANSMAALESAIEVCEKNGYKTEAARLLWKKAEFTSKTSDWLKAGESTYRAALTAPDTLTRDFLMEETVIALEKVLEKDPENINAQLFTGLALADKRETMMTGVPMLLKVVKADPDNLPANYTLALLAIESGQFDKALLRFEKLISLQPSNAEYLFQAGNAAMLNGEKDRAAAYFKKCLELTKDEALKEEINRILTNLK